MCVKNDSIRKTRLTFLKTSFFSGERHTFSLQLSRRLGPNLPHSDVSLDGVPVNAVCLLHCSDCGLGQACIFCVIKTP